MPDAFLALHSAHGRPLLDRPEMEARHAACEDLALQTAARLAESGVSEDDAHAVLQRIHAGLQARPDGASDGEDEWVVRRIAELLEWPQPETLGADRAR